MQPIRMCVIGIIGLVIILLILLDESNGKDVLKVTPKLKVLVPVKISKIAAISKKGPLTKKALSLPIIINKIKKLPIFKKKIPVLIFLKLLGLKKTVVFGPPVGIGAFVLGSGAGLAVDRYELFNYLYRFFFRTTHPFGWGWGWSRNNGSGRTGNNNNDVEFLREGDLEPELPLPPHIQKGLDIWKNQMNATEDFPGLSVNETERYLQHHFNKYLIDNPNEAQVAGLVKLLHQAYLQTLSDLEFENETVPDFTPLPFPHNIQTLTDKNETFVSDDAPTLPMVADFIPLPLPIAESSNTTVPVPDFIPLPISSNNLANDSLQTEGGANIAQDEENSSEEKMQQNKDGEFSPPDEESEDETLPSDDESLQEMITLVLNTKNESSIPDFTPLPISSSENVTMPVFVPFPIPEETNLQENLEQESSNSDSSEWRVDRGFDLPLNLNLGTEIQQVFTLLSTFDTDGCFEYLVCDIHTRINKKSEKLSSYENNVISMFRMMNSTLSNTRTPNDPITEKYFKAAEFGEENLSSKLCHLEYPQCKYSANELIKMGHDLDNSPNI